MLFVYELEALMLDLCQTEIIIVIDLQLLRYFLSTWFWMCSVGLSGMPGLVWRQQLQLLLKLVAHCLFDCKAGRCSLKLQLLPVQSHLHLCAVCLKTAKSSR